MRGVAALFIGAGLLASPSLALAHSGGVNGGGCGCHGAGEVGLDINVSPASFDPGDQITVTVSVSGGGNVAGVYVDSDEIGSLSTIGGQGLAVVNGGMSHASPKSMGGGTANWDFRWTAPNAPGAVRFTVWGVSANGNGGSSGDNASAGSFDFVFGCDAQQYYRDADGDGFGRTNSPLVHCAGTPPAGYATEPDDCDDNDPDQYPGAVEYCNQVDDDCDGMIDENALPVEQYPDADGDGFFGQLEYESGETFLGCVPTEGWAAEPGDCRPEDPTINPATEETCNGFDDDCDNDVDEFVRPQCGEGWCRRESIGCDPANCTPGEPRAEECNFFDDDCDGIVDNDVTCEEEGYTCQAGECRPEGSAADGDDDGGPADDGGGSDALDGGGGEGTAGGTGISGGGAADGGDGDGSGCACASAGSRTWRSMWMLSLIVVALRRRRRF